MASSSNTTQSEYAKSLFRQNITGTAYQRHQAYVRDYAEVYGDASSPQSKALKKTEFDVLKERHRFLRDDDKQEGSSAGNKSWEDAMAMKFESSLYKEFAVCDLKHYKSGNVALRWRTEDEALSSIGEETCGNTRCAYHTPQNERPVPKLLTLEVPFAYVEAGERKSALVKLVLCERCEGKLSWKRRKDKEEREVAEKGKAIGGDELDRNDDGTSGKRPKDKPRRSRRSRSPNREALASHRHDGEGGRERVRFEDDGSPNATPQSRHHASRHDQAHARDRSASPPRRSA